MSKILVRLAILALAILLAMPASAAKSTIVHLTGDHGQSMNDYLKAQAEIFNTQNPDIEVQIEVVAGNYLNNAQVRMASGLPIDVLDSTSTFTMLAHMDQLLDLAPFINRSPVANLNYLPSFALSTLTANGKLVGLPSQVFPQGVMYNKDIITEAGLPTPKQLGEDWTWSTLETMAKKLTRDLDGNNAIDIWGVDFARNLNRMDAAIWQAGGALYDRPLNPAKSLYNTEAARIGFSFYANLVKNNVAPVKGVSLGASRNLAIYLHGQTNWIDRIKSSMDTWEVSIQPKGPARRGTNVAFAPFHIWSQTKYPEAAWRWMEFLVFNYESMMKYAIATGRLPAFLPALQRMETYLTGDAKERNFILDFRNVALDPDNYPRYLTAAQSTIDSIFSKEWSKVLSGQQSVEMMLEMMHPLVQAELDTVNKE